MPTAADLSRTLEAAGFEVYRVLPDVIVVADRVRDNLILDSGVCVAYVGFLAVRFVTRARASDFPSDGPDALFERARTLGAAATSTGYREIHVREAPVLDPGNPSRTLDTWFEVAFEKAVDEDALAVEVTFALGVDKTASNRSG